MLHLCSTHATNTRAPAVFCVLRGGAQLVCIGLLGKPVDQALSLSLATGLQRIKAWHSTDKCQYKVPIIYMYIFVHEILVPARTAVRAGRQRVGASS